MYCSRSCWDQSRRMLTPERADIMFARVVPRPPRRLNRRKLTAHLFDRMVERRFNRLAG